MGYGEMVVWSDGGPDGGPVCWDQAGWMRDDGVGWWSAGLMDEQVGGGTETVERWRKWKGRLMEIWRRWQMVEKLDGG